MPGFIKSAEVPSLFIQNPVGCNPKLEVPMYLWSSPCWTVLLTSFLSTFAFAQCPRQRSFTSESPALKSLECRNDYRTHIRCNWRKYPNIPLALFHMDPDNYKVAPCVWTPTPPEPERAFCRYNTTLFAIGFDDVFFFQTPHSPGVSRSYNITKYNNTKWILNQVDDIPSRSYSSFDYLKTLLTSDPFGPHDQQDKIVDVDHESANMREENQIEATQKYQKDEVNKTETTGTSYYELPGPSNLHCIHDGGINVSCSWELLTDTARYIIYTLSYRTHSSTLSEWRCVDNVEVMDMGNLLRMIGVFNIFQPGGLQVELTPTPVTRVIHAYKHIQPARPTGVNVELIGQDWILNWTLPKYRTIRLTSQLEYWSILTPKDVKVVSLSDPVMVFSIPERTLIGFSEYRARVRCNVSTGRHWGQHYAGYPSEWTDPVSWTTRPEPFIPHLVAFVLYFLIVTLSAAVSVGVFFILVAMQRRMRDWNASLPSPVHSMASEVRQHHQRDLLSRSRDLKDPDISNVQIEDCLRFFSMDLERTIPGDGNTHIQQTHQNPVHLHVEDPIPRHFGNLSLNDAVLPCSDGYMQNPVTSNNSTHNALKEVCHRNAEMNDGYMNFIV